MGNKILSGRAEFIEGINSRFPKTLQEMSDLEDELLHVEMGDFARTTVSAILTKNKTLVLEHFNFISELLSNANPELENAIYVSYLENVLWNETKPEFQSARKLLPNNLKEALIGLEKHFEKPHDANRST